MLIEIRIIAGKIVEYSKVATAIGWLRAFEPEDGYWLAFSGGKDSVVIKKLAKMAGVKFEGHYSLTSVDPPELVRFILDEHPDIIVDRPKESMWQLIVRAGSPPMRMSRYCCSELKESGGIGRVTITGVRWAESVRRKANKNLVNIGDKKRRSELVYNDDNDDARRSVESCYRTKKTMVNPIIDWTDEDVWQFIREENIPYCSLYDEGFKRLGCIGCPMASAENKARDFKRWPTYKIAYIHAFDRMIARRKERGKPVDDQFESGVTCFTWWVRKDREKIKKKYGQIDMEDTL